VGSDVVSSYQKSLDFIYNLRGAEIDLRLERVARALSLFDNPQDRFKVLHIAGTNGKGSTAAMVHAMLSAAGYRVGLYTSPHLSDFTERVRVGRKCITKAAVTGLIKEVDQRIRPTGLRLTFFEFATVVAFLYFAREGVEAAVVEVGLGGRLDATNVVQSSVSVITTISRDHERFLGKHITSIAREKGGIIKPGVPLVCGVLPAAAQRAINEIARSSGVVVRQSGKDFAVTPHGSSSFDYRGREWLLEGLKLNLCGDYQLHNAGVALASLETLRATLPVREESIRAGLASVVWPGRFEVLPGKPTVILDGAHNEGAVKALVHEIRKRFGGGKVRLLFGSMVDKDWSAMLVALCAISREVVLTRVESERGADPSLLRSAVPRELSARTASDPVTAISSLVSERQKRDAPILVAGSLYLVGAVRDKALELVARSGGHLGG